MGPDSGHLEIEDMDLDLSADNHDISDEAHRPSHDHIPDVIIQLQKQLLGDYVLPPCPAEPPHQHTLSISETLSLKHYLAWSDTHGTVKAYNAHAQILAEATQEEILSLYKVKQLAMDLTGIRPTFVDMCPNSCMAFTGDAKSQSTCSYSHNGKDCTEPRYKSAKNSRAKPKPRATMLYMPITPIIQAFYANAETSKEMRHRDHCLQQALDALAQGAGVKKSEFSNSEKHIYHHNKMGLFHDKRDTAISISSDGAQLTMKKQSNMWLLIVLLLNLPPDMCYKAKNVIIPLAIPGPSAPGNIESFIYPLFEEMAQSSVGMWTWDAIDSSYFVLKAFICAVKGDMLGSAKLSGMAGHSALFGDRFSLVQGAFSSKTRGARAQYYPISPPDKDKYNPMRDTVNLAKLPLRGQNHYWRAIERLESATNKTERQRIVRDTGVSRATLSATGHAFLHPSFFPLDPFHLFYENCMTHIWDLWVSKDTNGEVIHMSEEMASELGEEIEKAMATLPPSFSGRIRNPDTKRSSQYKVFEWMALLHWYIIPIGLELGFNRNVLSNFAQFVDIVEVAMSHTPKSNEDLASLYNLVCSFLEGFERLYVQNDPAKVSRCWLCIWQLIHVPTHIAWNGSIRFGSQATCERAIGEIGHKVRSKKAPFANIATMLCERANNKVLTLKYPCLTTPHKNKSKEKPLYQSLPIRRVEKDNPSEYYMHLCAICDDLEIDFNMGLMIERWGKCVISENVTLTSRISEEAGQATRSSRYFEAKGDRPIFGEALAFYFVPDHNCSLVVYCPLVKTMEVLKRWHGEWSKDFAVLKISSLSKLVGIWVQEPRVHVLRRHAGMDMLNVEEYGMEE